MNGVQLPRLPDRAALMLDFDGTLIDLAATPSAVVIPPSLPDTLRAVRDCLDGAVALVTGRPLRDIDGFLGDAPYAVAAEHGAVFRHAPGAAPERPALPSAPAAWREQAQRVAAGYPGALFEPKESGFVLHYRGAPEAGPAFRQALLSIVGEHEDEFVVMPAHMAWEVKPRGADKGRAVERLMGRPPFAGRVPVYVGDDVTDEDGIRAARRAGGLGFKVQDVFKDPSGVRAWLKGLLEGEVIRCPG